MRARLLKKPLYRGVCRVLGVSAASAALALMFICAVPSRVAPYPWTQTDQPLVFGRTRLLADGVNQEIKGVASWYGAKFAGKKTASGEVFNPEKLTAASRDLPIGSHVLVTNLRNGRSVHVKINDCGPYVDGRDIDLSRKAARRLRIVRKGVAPVNIKVLWIPGGAERCSDGSEMQS
jgi:rare lipoprotein A